MVVLQEFSKEKLAHAFEANLCGKFSYLPSLINSATVLDQYGCTLINSHLPCDMFNIVCNMTSGDKTDVAAALSFFEADKLPFAWWLGFEGEPATLRDQIDQSRLEYAEDELAMAVEISSVPAIVGRDDFTIALVDNEARLSDMLAVFKAVVPDDVDMAEAFFSEAAPFLFEQAAKLQFYVGYIAGAPCALISLFYDSGVVGVFDMMVAPDARRQGLASLMMVRALSVAGDRGMHIATLSATDDAHFVYRRLGFQPIKKMAVYHLANY